MIQFYKPGDLTKWSYHIHRSRLRLRLCVRLDPRRHLRLRLCLRLDNSFGLILKIYDSKEIFEQVKNFKYYEPEKDLPYIWFSLEEKQSFLVFQDELSLVK